MHEEGLMCIDTLQSLSCVHGADLDLDRDLDALPDGTGIYIAAALPHLPKLKLPQGSP